MRKTKASATPTSHRFHNRDLSWWSFNERVLNEALDPRTPLLERLKFVDIFCSNTDEFYMKRMGPIIERIENEDSTRTIDGLNAPELYAFLQKKISRLRDKLHTALHKELLPKLSQEGIALLRLNNLSPREKNSRT